MELKALMADLWAAHRVPTEEESDFVLREGGYTEVAETLVLTAFTDKRLRARYRVLLDERMNPQRAKA